MFALGGGAVQFQSISFCYNTTNNTLVVITKKTPFSSSAAVLHLPPPWLLHFYVYRIIEEMRERQKKKHDDSTTTTDPSPSPSPSPPSRSPSPDESEDLQRLENAPPFWRSESSKRLSKQLSMVDLPGDAAWERRRRKSQRRKSGTNKEAEKITDEDLHELKGCIDLGFGFNEENGQRLCTTLPALDLYFAVNRQFVTSPISSPAAASAASPPPSLPPAAGRRGRSASFGSDAEAWRICSQGDDPRHVKTKLRHWALAVACSVKQSS